MQRDAKYKNCSWGCGYEYSEPFNQKTEMEHLYDCSVYQHRPVVEIREDGKRFVEDIFNSGIYIELLSRPN